MPVILFRVLAATFLILAFASILGGCAKPTDRNLWREMIQHGEL